MIYRRIGIRAAALNCALVCGIYFVMVHWGGLYNVAASKPATITITNDQLTASDLAELLSIKAAKFKFSAPKDNRYNINLVYRSDDMRPARVPIGRIGESVICRASLKPEAGAIQKSEKLNVRIDLISDGVTIQEISCPNPAMGRDTVIYWGAAEEGTKICRIPLVKSSREGGIKLEVMDNDSYIYIYRVC